MNLHILKHILFLPFLCLLSSNLSAANGISNPITDSDSVQVIRFIKNPVNPEKSYIKYPTDILSNKFDFQIDPISKGKFSLQFMNNTSSKFIGIKVYDIIGNLLISEKVFVNPKAEFEKEYDLSSHKSGLFIIEVGSSSNNRIKNILAAG